MDIEISSHNQRLRLPSLRCSIFPVSHFARFSYVEETFALKFWYTSSRSPDSNFPATKSHTSPRCRNLPRRNSRDCVKANRWFCNSSIRFLLDRSKSQTALGIASRMITRTCNHLFQKLDNAISVSVNGLQGKFPLLLKEKKKKEYKIEKYPSEQSREG